MLLWRSRANCSSFNMRAIFIIQKVLTSSIYWVTLNIPAIYDLIVIGYSDKHHIKNLTEIFETCKNYNLKLSPQKCDFFRNEVHCLGHRCTSNVYIHFKKLQRVSSCVVHMNNNAHLMLVKIWLDFIRLLHIFITFRLTWWPN